VAVDPSRYLIGGAPQAVVVPARIARRLDVAGLDAARRKFADGGVDDEELYAVLIAIHDAGLQYNETAAPGRTPLPQIDALPSSRHDLLTTADVAERLGCKPRNVRDLYERGRIVAERVGGRLLFDAAAVEGYLSDRN